MEQSLITISIVFLMTAVSIVPLFKKLGLGTVLGYLTAGALLGPWGFKVVSDVDKILHFSEFGVVILLFLIGLELKPQRLWVMRKPIFGYGSVQVFFTTALIFGVCRALGLSSTSSLIIGLGLSLSSTAFAIQMLTEKNLIQSQFGRLSFSILLFQDIIAIPVLALIPLLASDSFELSPSQLLSALQVLAVLAAIIICGRYVLKPILRYVANTRAREIFTAASLLLILGVSYLMLSLELSMALGSFLAGVVLSDSEYRHQLEADMEPFKGLLLGLFFMSIGMTVNFGVLGQNTLLISLLLFLLVFGKFIVIYALGKKYDLSNNSSINMGLTLCQGGEFAFVVFGLASQFNIINQTTTDILFVLVTLSMPASSLIFLAHEKLVTPRLNKRADQEFDSLPDHAPVIIAGFGRVGQIPGRLLRHLNIDFTALELDAEQVHTVRKFGNTIYYGDASRIDLLESAGAEKAKVFILAIDDVEASLRTAEIVRERFPHLKVFARARNRDHTFKLMELGITNIWRETFYSSLDMSRAIFKELGHSEEKIEKTFKLFVEHDQKMLSEQFKVYKDESQLITQSKLGTQQLTDVLRADENQDV